MTTGDNRSVSAGGDITGSIIQTGDHNRAELQAVQLPAAGSVDIAAVIAALRAELLALDTSEKDEAAHALDEAERQLARPEPDREEVGGRIKRALGFAKQASDFSDHLGKIQALVTKAAGWLGAASPYAAPLLAMVGLSAA